MNLTLKIWRQEDRDSRGKIVTYDIKDVPESASFLEMLDILNEGLINEAEEPVAFDHDCREGICGMCSLVINGEAHGPDSMTTVCQLHMRKFNDGDTIFIEPFRAKPFPVLKDLVVDRTAFDEIVQSGGFVDVRTGAPQDANSLPISKKYADISMDAAACIGCGACVAACKNASAMLFVSAKVGHLANLPQGAVQSKTRVKNMVSKMDELGFGNCTNQFECEAVCPKGISVDFISDMNRSYSYSSIIDLVK